MSELILTRHGQASFLKQDYDQLSDLGHQQMHALGVYWGQRALQPTQVFLGPRRRHQQSLEALQQGLLTQNKTRPTHTFEEGLDEYPAFEVLAKALPILATKEQDIADLIKVWQAKGPRAGHSFQKLLETVTRRWVRNTLDIPDIPAWTDFIKQTRAGLHNMTHQAPSGSTIVVATSAGTIATIVGQVLDLKNEKVLEMSWNLHNATFTRILFSSTGRFSLSTFNQSPHLTPETLTYR